MESPCSHVGCEEEQTVTYSEDLLEVQMLRDALEKRDKEANEEGLKNVELMKQLAAFNWSPKTRGAVEAGSIESGLIGWRNRCLSAEGKLKAVLEELALVREKETSHRLLVEGILGRKPTEQELLEGKV
jgi:hypothetical protein